MQWNKIDATLAGQLAEMEKTPHEHSLNGFVKINLSSVKTLESVSYDFIDMLSEQSWVAALLGYRDLDLK